MKHKIFSFFLTAAAVWSLAVNARSATCYAVDEGNKLYKFDSATPASTTFTAITGLPMNYRIVGLDFRTTTHGTGAANLGAGSLWALGTDGTQAKLFVVDPSTAAATFVGNISLPAMMLNGSDNGWGFGFNPATDTLRVMNFIYNYQVDPNTLVATAQTQFNTAFNQGLNPNGFPALNGAAYTTAPFGGSSRIYFLEQGNDGLNTSADISTGAYSAFPMPMVPAFSQTDGAGLDIDGGLLLMSCFDTTVTRERLFSVTTSGVFTPIGDISATPTTLRLRSLAIQPTSFPMPLSVTVKIKGKKKITTTATKLTIKGTASSQAGITKVQYKAGKGGFKTAKGTTTWSFKAKLKPGTNKIQVKAIGGNGVASKVAKATVTVITAK
jgi:hypothetical protein